MSILQSNITYNRQYQTNKVMGLNMGISTIIVAEDSGEKYCFVRFFNAAQNAETMDIYINSELVVKGLKNGEFTPFRRAKAGVYNMEVRIDAEGTHMDYAELVSLMDDTAYTLALTGDASHLGMAVLTLNMNQDNWQPSIRFANLLANDEVIDIEVDGQKAITGLMFREVSEEVDVTTGHYAIKVFDANSDVILQNNLEITQSDRYLCIIFGDSGNPQSPPQLSVSEDSPVL